MGVKIGGWSLVLLLGSVNAACMNFRPPPRPIPDALAGDAPRELWSTQPTRRLVGQIAVEDGLLYGGGLDRKAHAVSLEDGQTRWSRGLSGPLTGGILKVDSVVYAGTDRPDGKVYALRAADGKERWKRDTDPVSAPLALVDGVLVVPTHEGEVLGLDPATGKIRWRARAGVARARPMAAGPRGVLISTLDSLFRLSTDSGEVLARRAAPGAVVSRWVQNGELLVAGTADSQIVGLRPATLEIAWRVRVDAPVLAAPLVRGDTIVAVSRRGTVYRLVAHAGGAPSVEEVVALEWPVTAAPAFIGGRLVIGGADGVVRGLHPDGSEAWRLGVWRPVVVSPFAVGSGLIVLGGNGDIHRYQP